MASVWFQRPGKPPKKLVGGLPYSIALATLGGKANQIARLNGGNVLATPLGCEAIVVLPGNVRVSLFVEPLSPPSAPELGQPLRKVKS